MPATLLRILTAAVCETPDAELLGRFVANRDDRAFEELLRRHGPAVWRVCRRLAGSNSADDAFQATFLVLACRADSVRKATSVGSWLVGVAGRVARHQRRLQSHDRAHLLEAIPARERSVDLEELAGILDVELSRLPERLRDPAVLCWMQGRTQSEAATELGSSIRTIRRRLDRAKSVLRARLERRGVAPALAAGLVATVQAPAVAVPRELVENTIRTIHVQLAGGTVAPASILAKGVDMGSRKLVGGGFVAAAVFMIGIGIGLADDPVKPPAAAEKPNALVPAAAVLNAGDAKTSVFRSANFHVIAPTPTQARIIAAEAEHHRRELAVRWLGKELPKWKSRCVIRSEESSTGATTSEKMIGLPFLRATESSTTFQFEAASLVSAEMSLRGPFLVLVEKLPHEVAHCVIATHFGKAIPRWADEGIALVSEEVDFGDQVRDILVEGRVYRLKHIFPRMDYPKDITVFHAQAHSIVKFLLATKPVKYFLPGAEESGIVRRAPEPGVFGITMQRPAENGFMEFVARGSNGNTAESWDKAAKQVYGFDSDDALEDAWVESLRKAESKPKSRVPGEDPDRIPPPKAPGR